MPATPKPPEPSASIVDHLRAPLDRARDGDPEALAEVRRALDEHPEVWRQAGDLAAQVESAWIGLFIGADPTARECLTRRMAELKAGLLGTAGQGNADLRQRSLQLQIELEKRIFHGHI